MNDNLSRYLISNTILWKNLSVKSLFVLFVLAVSIAFCGQGETAAHENHASTTSTKLKVTFDPPAEDMPKTSMGGASRSTGQCINMDATESAIPFSALLPANDEGLTVAARPTVLAYIPETSADRLFFSWQDENNGDHYQTVLPMNRTGIVSLTLPEDAPPLEINKNYQWALGIMCDGRLQPDSPMVQGQVKRVAIAPGLSDRLQNASSLERAVLYGEAGIWYETAAALEQLKKTQPQDLDVVANWQDLLTSVGLAEIAEVSTNNL